MWMHVFYDMTGQPGDIRMAGISNNPRAPHDFYRVRVVPQARQNLFIVLSEVRRCTVDLPFSIASPR